MFSDQSQSYYNSQATGVMSLQKRYRQIRRFKGGVMGTVFKAQDMASPGLYRLLSFCLPLPCIGMGGASACACPKARFCSRGAHSLVNMVHVWCLIRSLFAIYLGLFCHILRSLFAIYLGLFCQRTWCACDVWVPQRRTHSTVREHNL